MIMNGLKTNGTPMVWGTKEDYCIFCFREKLAENEMAKREDKKNSSDILKELKKNNICAPMLKIKNIGEPICICKDHLKKYYEESIQMDNINKEEKK